MHGEHGEHGRTLSKGEARHVLTSVGLPPHEIEGILGELPDPIDLDDAEAMLAEHGITREHLVDWRGGSP